MRKQKLKKARKNKFVSLYPIDSNTTNNNKNTAMPRLKAIFLFVSVLVCFGTLPVTQGYLDVSGGGGRNTEESSPPTSVENDYPHSIRHQEHYNHRPEHDFKKKSHSSPLLSSSRNSSLSVHQTNLRHNHHSRFITTLAPTASSKSGHHLRHHNRRHESRESRLFPPLGQQHHKAPLSLGTTTTMRPDKFNLTKAMQSRLFDRDSLYPMPTARTTTGPKSRHNYGSHILPSIDRAYGDDNRFSDRETERQQTYSTKNNADIHLLSAGDYKEEEDYAYDSADDEEYEADEEALDVEKWNKIELKDTRDKRAQHPSAKHWINTDDAESIYPFHNTPGILTQQKFEELGTHDAVKQSRKAHITTHRHHKEMANAHAKRVYSEANCQLPQQRIERIQKDPSKIYVPHCTILHRCGDDTGCCKTDRQTCAPKRTQSVDLYFFVKSLNSKQGSIEKHTFINHTECHCVDKGRHHMQSYNDPAQIMRKATVLDCNCPKLFEKILQENGVCRCDCSSGNIDCNYLKRGLEHFSMVDRKCIIEGRCKPPTCEYGNYLKKHGRCQRSTEAALQSTLSWSYN